MQSVNHPGAFDKLATITSIDLVTIGIEVEKVSPSSFFSPF
jgi:hypothetical protein